MHDTNTAPRIVHITAISSRFEISPDISVLPGEFYDAKATFANKLKMLRDQMRDGAVTYHPELGGGSPAKAHTPFNAWTNWAKEHDPPDWNK